MLNTELNKQTLKKNKVSVVTNEGVADIYEFQGTLSRVSPTQTQV